MFPCILELLNQIVEDIVLHKLFSDQINKTIICQEKLLALLAVHYKQP